MFLQAVERCSASGRRSLVMLLVQLEARLRSSPLVSIIIVHHSEVIYCNIDIADETNGQRVRCAMSIAMSDARWVPRYQ